MKPEENQLKYKANSKRIEKHKSRN